MVNGKSQLYALLGLYGINLLLYTIWQPIAKRMPLFGGKCNVNANLLQASYVGFQMITVGLALWPVEECEPLPDFVQTIMLISAAMTALIPLIFVMGTIIGAIDKCVKKFCRKRNKVAVVGAQDSKGVCSFTL